MYIILSDVCVCVFVCVCVCVYMYVCSSDFSTSAENYTDNCTVSTV